jgi:hypothetical protein
LLAAPPTPARPKKGTLTVRAKRLGSGPRAETIRTLRVVDASTGDVLLASNLAANGKATRRPPAAVAFAIATVSRPTGVRTGLKVFARMHARGRCLAGDGRGAVRVDLPFEPHRPRRTVAPLPACPALR